MTNYDEQLQSLRQLVSRKHHLEKKLSELSTQRDPLTQRVRDLESAKLSEQADVDRLEGRSLASFFFNVIGKMDEQLDKERQEAYAAAVKYDAAARELSALESDMAHYKSQLMELNDCEARYDKLLAEKQSALKAAGGSDCDRILGIEARLTHLENRMDEIDEAIAAGDRAMDAARQVLDSLRSAANWGTLDLLGGGLLADLGKHDRLDAAQSQIELLQVELRRFKTELADVDTIHADLQISIDGFLRFADFFFDNLFTDWAVMDKISKSREQVEDTVRRIESVLCHLTDMMNNDQAEWKRLHDELDELVICAKI